MRKIDWMSYGQMLIIVAAPVVLIVCIELFYK